MRLLTTEENQQIDRQVVGRATDKPLTEKEVRESWGWFIALGCLMILLGGFAIVAANIATLATVLMFGLLLMLIGVAQIAQAIQARYWSGFGLHACGGLLYTVTGALLVLTPTAGAVTLTLILAVLFIAGGVVRLLLARRTGSENRAIGLYVAGGLSLVLGVLVAFGWPGISMYLIGLYVGVELMVAGAGLMLLGIEGRAAK